MTEKYLPVEVESTLNEKYAGTRVRTPYGEGIIESFNAVKAEWSIRVGDTIKKIKLNDFRAFPLD